MESSMNVTLRLASALLVAAILALPGVGNDGGENAGGTGVWILPRASFLSSPGSIVGVQGAVVDPLVRTSLQTEVALMTAIEMTSFTATLIDGVSGAPMALPTNGRNVVVPSCVLQGLSDAGTTEAHVVVVDANQLGYVLRLAIDSSSASVTLSLDGSGS